ncbi:MAG: InlB B-repeat-containing protein [Firmicutes bacterium]|nr:InlB B-repeat-containing protein [Bacillota bacterium]
MKRKSLPLALLLCLTLFVFGIAVFSIPNENKTISANPVGPWTITFQSPTNLTATAWVTTTSTVITGQTVTAPSQNPTHPLGNFVFWASSQTPTVPFNFNTPITADITLRAVFTGNGAYIPSSNVNFWHLYQSFENVPGAFPITNIAGTRNVQSPLRGPAIGVHFTSTILTMDPIPAGLRPATSMAFSITPVAANPVSVDRSFITNARLTALNLDYREFSATMISPTATTPITLAQIENLIDGTSQINIGLTNYITVQYRVHGGTPVTQIIRRNVHSNITTIATNQSTQRIGHIFLHWSLTQNGPQFDFTQPLIDPITLHAVWRQPTAGEVREITFHTNHTNAGISNRESITRNVPFGTHLVGVGHYFPIPSDIPNGFVFRGWSTIPNMANPYAEIQLGSFTNVTAGNSIAYHAVFARGHQLTLNIGGNAQTGQHTRHFAVLEANNTFNLLFVTPDEREGQTFRGWATSRRGAVVYAPDAQITITGDTTLWAVWEADSAWWIMPSIALGILALIALLLFIFRKRQS